MRISESQAAERLVKGEVVAIPTETVYGLAASIAHPGAIEAIFSLKGRPQNNPLIVHLANQLDALFEFVKEPVEGLEALVEHFWPGPLTLVLPVHEGLISPLARAGLPTAAFRMPLHPIAQGILSHTGPLVAPSANRSGSPSSTCVEHVESDFGLLFPVVDGGSCERGVESTILIAHAGRWRIGRLGALAPETLADVLGYMPLWELPKGEAQTQVCCPGQLYRHYAPRAKLILGETDYIDYLERRGHIGEGGRCSDSPVVLGFADRHYEGAERIFALSASDDPVGALNQLYHLLRMLDQEQIHSAWVDLRMPQTGLWRTLRERLIRAAAG